MSAFRHPFCLAANQKPFIENIIYQNKTEEKVVVRKYCFFKCPSSMQKMPGFPQLAIPTQYWKFVILIKKSVYRFFS